MYLILYSLFMILCFNELKCRYQNEEKIKLFIGLVFLLTVVAGFRYYVGTDYGSYVEIFNGINNIHDYSYLEIGFRFIIIFIKIFTHNEMVFFMVIASISMIFVAKGIEQSSKNILLSLMIFFSIFYISYIFNALRQGLSMCIFIYSLRFFEEENTKKVIILSFIATLIHSSGMFIIFAYIVKNFNFNYKSLIYILIIGIALIIFNPLEKILSHIEILGIANKIKAYSTYSDRLDIISILQRLIIFIFILYGSKSMTLKDKKIFNIYTWGWIMYCIFSFQGMIATRVNMFFRILEIILIPNIIYYEDNKKIKYLQYIFILIWITTILLVTLKNPSNYPYKLYFIKNQF